MRLFIFLVGITLLPVFAFGQSTELRIGKSIPIKFYPKRIILDKNSEKLVSMPDVKIFNRLDLNTLIEVNTKIECMENTGFPFAYFQPFLIPIKNKIYYIYIGRKGEKRKDRKKKPYSIWLQELDPNLGKCIDSPKELLKIKEDFTLTPKVFYKKNKVDEIEKIIFVIRKKPENRNDAVNNEKVEINIFDSKFNLTKQSILKMPHTEQKMDNTTYFFGNDDTPYLLAKVRDDGNAQNYTTKGKKAFLKFHYELMEFDMDNNTVEITRLDINNKYPIKAIPLLDNQGNLKISGFYSNSVADNGKPPINGAFLFSVNLTTKEVSQDWHEIPLELLNRYETEKEQEKNKEETAGLENCLLKNAILLDDNSIVLGGEQEFAERNNQGDYNHYYNDLFLFKINADGQLSWMNRIPKRGNSYDVSGNYNSSISIKNDNSLYWFGMDNSRNINITDTQVPSEYEKKSGVYTVCKIDMQTGSFEKEVVFRSVKKNGVTLDPSAILSTHRISDTELLIQQKTPGRTQYSINKAPILITIKE